MIVYCCHDLIFATKIHSTTEALGLSCRPARSLNALQKRLDQIDDGKPCGAVVAVIVDLTLGEAALDLIDLARRQDPAPTVVAFAPHVEVALLDAAEKRGADRVMPRGAFSAELPDLLTSLAGHIADPTD
jgi:hypothetical protein